MIKLLKKSFLRLVMREPIKYDLCIHHFTAYEVNEECDKLQSEGWEICSQIWMHPTKTWCGDKSIRIAFRRPKKNHYL